MGREVRSRPHRRACPAGRQRELLRSYTHRRSIFTHATLGSVYIVQAMLRCGLGDDEVCTLCPLSIPSLAIRRHPWGVALLEGWSLERPRCGGTSTLQTLGFPVSLPFRRAASVCGTLRPREGELHDRWPVCTNSGRGEAASLQVVIGCAVDPTIPCGSLNLSARIAET